MVVTVLIVCNLLGDQIHTSLMILIRNDMLSRVPVLSILLELVCLVLNILASVRNILCVI
jgi:hypothetical protein